MSGWADRQLPQGDELFVDHVGYFVPDLDAAGAQLERLGFRVSLTNVQTNQDATGALQPSGTSNRLARLSRGFIEILAATHDTPLAAQFRLALARYAGLHLIAFSHDDIAATRARIVAAGFAMQDVVELRRRDRTLPGEPVVHFSVLRPQPGVMAEGRMQFVKPHTPDTVWAPETITTENGAESLTDTLLCVDDPAEAAARFARYLGRAVTMRSGLRAIETDRGALLFADVAHVRRLLPRFEPPALPYLAGQALRADVGKARAALAKGGVSPVMASRDLICVAPQDALGSFMLFHAPGIDDPWSMLSSSSSNGR